MYLTLTVYAYHYFILYTGFNREVNTNPRRATESADLRREQSALNGAVPLLPLTS